MESKSERTSNVDRVEVEQVIHVISAFGKGIEGDPVRMIHEYYTMDGNLIARLDPTMTNKFLKSNSQPVKG